jgi:hypothetical protein
VKAPKNLLSLSKMVIKTFLLHEIKKFVGSEFTHLLKTGYTTARVTIENFWARSGQEAGEKRARTFTNFDRGTVDFRHMGVLVSRICTIFYGES